MEQNLISKIVADKESKKIGKVIRVENLPDVITKKTTPHLIILVQRFLKTDVTISISSSRITKIEGNYVWLDITKEEYQRLLKDAKTIKEYRSEYLANKEYKPPKQSGSSPGRR